MLPCRHMERKTFLKYLSILPFSSLAMNLKDFASRVEQGAPNEKMPLLFVGHGNPMNAITDNIYKKEWEQIAKKIAVPKAILCISAHWLTKGTFVTMAEKPITIHDFGGFPDELFQQQYPAKGAVDYAKMTIEHVKSTPVHEDFEWGLDHGAWSVLKAMYPLADIPVYQMSIDYTKPVEYHFNLAKELAFLRTKGVLIVGSGNVVHNLGRLSMNGAPVDWALEFDAYVKKNIDEDTPKNLVDYAKLGTLATLAHPSNDHYLPLIYTLGLRDKTDEKMYFTESFDLGSISMRSVMFS
jgi:4,5-DOPA dioxygenase extradiol